MTSRFAGVFWHEVKNKWEGNLWHQGSRYCTGYFLSETDAALSVNFKCDKLKIARLNPNFIIPKCPPRSKQSNVDKTSSKFPKPFDILSKVKLPDPPIMSSQDDEALSMLPKSPIPHKVDDEVRTTIALYSNLTKTLGADTEKSSPLINTNADELSQDEQIRSTLELFSNLSTQAKENEIAKKHITVNESILKFIIPNFFLR